MGIPVITSSTGENQAKATFAMTEQWQLTDHVRALVFDTTASNSGWRMGACVLLEKRLNKKLLMLACRHHVYERILSAVHRELFGPTSGPDNADFVHFRDSLWKNINTEKGFIRLQIGDCSLQLRRNVVVEALKGILTNELPRRDYRECVELMLLLGETPARGEHGLRPGAAHHARWMPSVLYPAKNVSIQLTGGYDSKMILKLKSLCQFNALFYVEKWLSASAAAHSAYYDLQLWHELNEYRRHDPKVADAAIAALEKHFWYLTEEGAVFSLFSSRVPDADKQHIAQQLLRQPRPGHNSWFLFHCLSIKASWLGKPVKFWSEDVDYQEAETFVGHVEVVNYLSERAIQLLQSFATSITKDETPKDYLLQVVEHHRKTILTT